MNPIERPLAVVTGASSGIGYGLAKCCSMNGFDLIVAADDAGIHDAAQLLREDGGRVDPVQVDLATVDGVARLVHAIGERPVEALLANAGHGLGEAFLDQDRDRIRHVIDTNVTGTVELVHRVGQRMRARGRGRILLTGSIAGVLPGSFHAVYNATKAFVDSFAVALRDELADSGLTVTCLMPGATETRFFERAGLAGTRLGRLDKDDPADVALAGFRAMMRGDAGVVTGFKNKLQFMAAHVTPAGLLARQHRHQARPTRSRG